MSHTAIRRWLEEHTPIEPTLLDGAGLGMAIAREIIERHQGSITIRNRQPRGLEQICTLPCT